MVVAEQDECPICLGALGGQALSLGCGHCFCAPCLLPTLMDDPIGRWRCASCRAHVDPSAVVAVVDLPAAAGRHFFPRDSACGEALHPGGCSRGGVLQLAGVQSLLAAAATALADVEAAGGGLGRASSLTGSCSSSGKGGGKGLAGPAVAACLGAVAARLCPPPVLHAALSALVSYRLQRLLNPKAPAAATRALRWAAAALALAGWWWLGNAALQAYFSGAGALLCTASEAAAHWTAGGGAQCLVRRRGATHPLWYFCMLWAITAWLAAEAACRRGVRLWRVARDLDSYLPPIMICWSAVTLAFTTAVLLLCTLIDLALWLALYPAMSWMGAHSPRVTS